MHRLLLAAAAGLVPLAVALSAWAAPVVTVAIPEHDFGTILQGETVRHAFIFANAGDVPLTVEKVSSSCGCTAALASAKVLAPGERGELQTTFDSTRFRGRVRKTVYLYTNDPAQPLVHLQIKGEIREELALEPPVVDFGATPPRKTVRSSVTLVNQGDHEVRLDQLETTTPELAARLSAQVVPPGGQATVTLTLTPKPGQARFSGYVLFKAAGTLRHDLRIPVYAELSD